MHTEQTQAQISLTVPQTDFRMSRKRLMLTRLIKDNQLHGTEFIFRT